MAALRSGRHYVTLGKHRFRNFLVIRTNVEQVSHPRSRRLTARYTYTTVKRCWTWKGAVKASRRFNAQNGHSD